MALVFLAALLGLLALLDLLSVVEVVLVELGLGERSRRAISCLEEVVGVVDDIYFPLANPLNNLTLLAS
jgi:hypothetical protein